MNGPRPSGSRLDEPPVATLPDPQGTRLVLNRYESWAEALPTVLAGLVVAGLVAIGLVFRLMFIEHRPLTSDEAVPGIMAAQMLHGHFVAFYWGQYYGGTLETLLIAAAFAVFGQTATTLVAVSLVTAILTAVLTWRIAARLVDSAWIAAFAGLVVWLAPSAAVINSAFEWSFRGMTFVCGLLAVLAAIRLRDSRVPLADSVLLGLALGGGWWSSPEIIYFAFPAVLIALGSLRRRWWEDSPQRVAGYAGSTVVAFLLGALPWIWANVGSHLASLNEKHMGLPQNAPGYFGHLRIFFQYSVGLLFGLRAQQGWLGGRAVGLTLLWVLVALLVGALVLCLRRGGPAAVLAVSLIAFPFMLAINPAVWFWYDGRYVCYAVPLLVLVLAAGYAGAGKKVRSVARHLARRPARYGRAGTRRVGSAAFLAGAALMIVVSLDGFHFGRALPRTPDPNGPARKAAAALEAAGVHYGYADYWVAYYLDFLSREHLVLASTPLHDRNPAMTREVEAAPSAAWVFVPSIHGIDYFGGGKELRGPDVMPEAQFLALLQHRHIKYRIIDAGVVTAVVPARNLSPRHL